MQLLAILQGTNDRLLSGPATLDQVQFYFRTEVKDDKLTIRHLEIFDDGIYTCKATNQFGSAVHE